MKDNNSTFSKNLLRHIRHFFSVDLFWKICSLIVAIIMWFFVMNTINPTETKTFTSKIFFENMTELNNKGYVVSNLRDFENTSVSVKIEATRPALDELNKAENRANFKVKADLSKLDINSNDTFPKAYTISITPSIPVNSYMYKYDVASYYPSVIEVIIDKAANKTVPVELREYGSPASGYVASSPKSSVTQVVVTGPASLVADVDKAIATIDITNESASVTKNCETRILDEEGNALSNFVVSPQTIPVAVEIRKSTSIKINSPKTKGALPSHLKLTSIDWSPKTIDVVTGVSEPIPSINLEDIDLSTVNGTQTIEQDLSDTLEKLGIESVAKSNKVTITVNVSVVDATSYTIPSSTIRVIGSAPNKKVDMPESITAEIGGTAPIDIGSLAPVIDITGLSAGNHTVPVNITLPPNSALEKDLEISIKISEHTEAVTETTTTEAVAESTSELSNK